MCLGKAEGQEQEMAQSGMPGPLFLPSPKLEEPPVSVCLVASENCSLLCHAYMLRHSDLMCIWWDGDGGQRKGKKSINSI